MTRSFSVICFREKVAEVRDDEGPVVVAQCDFGNCGVRPELNGSNWQRQQSQRVRSYRRAENSTAKLFQLRFRPKNCFSDWFLLKWLQLQTPNEARSSPRSSVIELNRLLSLTFYCCATKCISAGSKYVSIASWRRLCVYACRVVGATAFLPLKWGNHCYINHAIA
jgi:hypothetical protein